MHMPNRFTYTTFSLDNERRRVNFSYQLYHDDQQYNFTESLLFPVALPDSTAITNALRSLHLASGISYYKIFVSPAIEHSYSMTSDEAAFWNNVWRNGLGEFLYVNKLSPELLAQFSQQDGESSLPVAAMHEAAGAVLGIGGGKDSIVAGELLKACGVDVHGFVMATGEQRGQAASVSEAMGVPIHVVERSLDRELLTVQQQPGAYRGHVPISLIFGLVGTVLALATGKQYVVVANEASASIPRVTGEHGDVNHQWSKSFSFEQSFQAYVQTYIAEVTYFSAVRQLTSVGVAKVFARYPAYFSVFTSDNSVFRIDPSQRPNTLWSLESPKSLSSFMLLAPWLTETEMISIFGRDFLNETSLETLFLELTGLQGEPPLDCVGTVDELIVSLNLAYLQGKYATSYLVGVAIERGVIQLNDWQAQQNTMLTLQPEQALPTELETAITDKLKDLLR
ncbi:UDP-N-acetyl-alpha-D-muramoyl-L-alanyl-L-glutamate epimerase [soil metagenome]